MKFLDKQVYGISSSKIKIFKGIIVEKVISTLSSLASKYFLGGNVVGGTVNTMTGFNEIFKEAIAAEHFNLKEFGMANKLYFSSFGKNWWNGGKEFKEDKIIEYKDRVSHADNLICHFAYVYDFNFKYSLQIIYKNNYIDRLYKRHVFKDNKTMKRYNEIYELAKKYVKEKALL